VTISDYPQYDGADALYTGLSSSLQTSVSDGTFNTELHKAAKDYDATDMLNVTATATNSSNLNVLTPTYRPTKAPNHTSKTQPPISHTAMVILVAVFAFIGGFALFFTIHNICCRKPEIVDHRNRNVTREFALQDVTSIAAEGINGPNPMHGQKAGNYGVPIDGPVGQYY
jgi:hypothetical protein